MHVRALILLLTLLPAGIFAAEKEDTLGDGRSLTRSFFAREIDTVWQRMIPEMQAALKSKQGLAEFHDQVSSQLGEEQKIVDEKTSREGQIRIYLRRSRFERFTGVILVQWAFAPDGQVAGFFVRPDQTGEQAPAPSAHLDRPTSTQLHLPFADEYFVFWGGRTVEQNYHAVDRNQRFAYDLLIMRDGVSHAAKGRRNEDYFCYGRTILAPAAGTVTEVIDDVIDNTPGQMNPKQITGNRVVIDHGKSEYSLLAHLRHGSIGVRTGDTVAVGQKIGECGNSGNSSEPHLHYQLQDGPAFGTSAGLPAQFVDFVADERIVARGEPTRGQRIRPQPRD